MESESVLKTVTHAVYTCFLGERSRILISDMFAGFFEIFAMFGGFGVGFFFGAIDVINNADKDENYESD